MLARLHSRLPVAGLRVTRGGFHSSSLAESRPRYGAGTRGQRFVPARARLAEKPAQTPKSTFRPVLSANSLVKLAKSLPDKSSEASTKPKKFRPRERKLIIDLPESPTSNRDAAPHIPTSSKSRFTSPPLLPGLVAQIHELLGPSAKPSPVQALSLAHFFCDGKVTAGEGTLLAAETGSGKSLAYLLPLVQALKASESSAAAPSNLATPRGLVLVPTHELARQVKSTLSHLTHAPDTKLRSVCLSTGNAAALSGRDLPQDTTFTPDESGDLQIGAPASSTRRGVDVVVGTPARVLDLTRPGGRNSVGPMRPGQNDTVTREFEREVKMGFGAIEWVVVDEADVLFDPDFALYTESILQSIQTRFNLILTTATVSAQLDTYLSKYHPQLTRLTTPDLHRLPASLQTEHVNWDRRPGNRNPTILRKLQDSWAEDTRLHPGWKTKSKVVIFCNRSKKVDELGAYLASEGVRCVCMTSGAEGRQRGSNKHIEAFLKPLPGSKREPGPEDPDVLITTSLLSRGLDFAPSVRSVFIVDEPRNEVDFVHRAGRTGRAGRAGKVVVFTKGSAGGEKRAPWARKKVSAFDAA